MKGSIHRLKTHHVNEGALLNSVEQLSLTHTDIQPNAV